LPLRITTVSVCCLYRKSQY